MKKLFVLLLPFIATTMIAKNTTTDVTVDCGTQVQITATPATGYHFVEWNDHNTESTRIITPTADAQYIAIFAINQYTIIFQNYDGSELQNETLNHGDAVSYKGSMPTRPATAQYTYTFSGWSPNISYTALDDATYTAQYDEVLNKYTITFLDWDGTVLQSSEWSYGTMPSYSGVTPNRPANSGFTYTFAGWDKSISVVTGTVTYTAQYTSVAKSYTITTMGENGTITGNGTYQYGTSVTITATPDDCYEFVRWSDEAEGEPTVGSSRTITVTGSATYIAIFRKIRYAITTAPDDTSHGTTNAVEI